MPCRLVPIAMFHFIHLVAQTQYQGHTHRLRGNYPRPHGFVAHRHVSVACWVRKLPERIGEILGFVIGHQDSDPFKRKNVRYADILQVGLVRCPIPVGQTPVAGFDLPNSSFRFRLNFRDNLLHHNLVQPLLVVSVPYRTFLVPSLPQRVACKAYAMSGTSFYCGCNTRTIQCRLGWAFQRRPVVCYRMCITWSISTYPAGGRVAMNSCSQSVELLSSMERMENEVASHWRVSMKRRSATHRPLESMTICLCSPLLEISIMLG